MSGIPRRFSAVGKREGRKEGGSARVVLRLALAVTERAWLGCFFNLFGSFLALVALRRRKIWHGCLFSLPRLLCVCVFFSPVVLRFTRLIDRPLPVSKLGTSSVCNAWNWIASLWMTPFWWKCYGLLSHSAAASRGVRIRH